MEVRPIQAKLNADAKADLTPLVQATADWIAAPRKWLEKLSNAMVGTWVARREQAIAFTRAETIRKCRLIEEGKLSYRDGQLLPAPEPTTDVFAALHELNHQGDAKRLEQAILEAARQLSGVPDDQISDEPLSQTFFNRWRREAEAIDEDDLRTLWAGLLKEEVVEPGTISPKTLDVIKDLSRADCECFMRLCKGVIKNELLVTYDNKPVFGVYEDVVRLQDVGLISHLQSAVSIYAANGESRITMSFAPSQLGVSVETADFCIDTFSLSNAGVELLRVSGCPVLSDEDVRTIKQHIDKVSFQETRFVEETLNADNWHWIRGHRPARFE